MKKLLLALCSILAFVCAGALVMLIGEIIIEKTIDFKYVIVFLGVTFSFMKMIQKYKTLSKDLRELVEVCNKKYGEHLRDAFVSDKNSFEKLCYAIGLYITDKTPKSIKLLSKLESKTAHPNDRYAVMFFSGICYSEIRAYPAAISCYRQALDCRETSTAVSNLGLCYIRIGDTGMAEECYNRAISIDPDNEYAYNNMAFCYIDRMDYEAAMPFAEKAVELNPKFGIGASTAAICHAALGNDERCQMYFNIAVSNGYDANVLTSAIESAKNKSPLDP